MNVLSGIKTWLWVNSLRIQAKLGVPVAQYNLGILYFQVEDYAEALRWLQKAGEQDFSPAYIVLGEMYSRGEGVPQDQEMALKWFAAGP